MNKVLYQKTKTGKIQQWSIWVVKKGESGYPEVHVEHGQTDGKKQTTFDVIKEGVNEGKSNATTAFEQAVLVMERKVTKQLEKGYVEDLNDTDKDSTLDWSKPLPKELCFYKPQNSIEPEKVRKLEKAGRAIYTVKRDGMCHIARMSDFGAEVYTRRMDLVSGNYPHLMSVFKSLPKRTILIGELILNARKKDSENFKLISKICRSDPEESIRKQEEFGKVQFYTFDIAFHKGKDLLTTTTFEKRREILLNVIKDLDSEYVIASEVISSSHSAAMKVVKQRELEGLVIWDKDGIMGSGRAYTMSGKPDRPNVLWKDKPKREDDFIVRWDPDKEIGDYGKGKNKGRFGKGFIYQLNGSEEVYLGKCGGGLTDKQRDFYTDTKLFPRVWRIEYDFAQPGTGALRFPVFNADRTLQGDKELNECEMSDEIRTAREENEDE